MFNPPKVAEWQWLDESCGLWFPWYTLGALEIIKDFDIQGKNVFEYGGGRSTLWWLAKGANTVCVIERDENYRNIIHEGCPKINGDSRAIINPSNAREGIQEEMEAYVNWIDISKAFPFSFVIVDDIFRYECMVKALTLPRPLTLIVDNWQQDQVFICPAAEDLMKDYEGQFFTQPDHQNHEGRPWTTAIWHLK